LNDFRKGCDIPRMQFYMILSEILKRVITEVCQPSIFLSFESNTYTQLILIDLPGDPVFIQPFRKCFPVHHGQIIVILIPYISLRIFLLFFTDRTCPEKQTVWSSPRK